MRWKCERSIQDSFNIGSMSDHLLTELEIVETVIVLSNHWWLIISTQKTIYSKLLISIIWYYRIILVIVESGQPSSHSVLPASIGHVVAKLNGNLLLQVCSRFQKISYTWASKNVTRRRRSKRSIGWRVAARYHRPEVVQWSLPSVAR